MAQTQAPNLTNLFADLHRLGQSGDYERALKVANKILAENQQDEKAFHCKIVCWLQMGKFEEALTAINRNHAISSYLIFEKAYCEYRLNRTNEALRTLQSVEELSDRERELLAQVLYRLERYQESFDVYRQLVKNTQDDYEEERETNMSAVMAALQTWTDADVPEDVGLREHTYELCYNAACLLVGRKMYAEAAEKLREAEKICRESFEDDPEATEEDIDAELGVIRVQLGYVLQKMGKKDEGMKLYNQVLKQKPSDMAVSAVASNNIVSLNKDVNVFDSKKKIKTATADSLKQKLTSSQRHTISMNQCLLYMYMNQGDQCHRTAQELQKKHPTDQMPCLIQAAQYCRDKQVTKAIDALKSQIEGGSMNNGGGMSLKLTLAQLYLLHGHVYQACDVLRTLGELAYKPGVVSTLVTLYLSQEDHEEASAVLNEAVTWYKKNKPQSEELTSLMRANANFQHRHGDPKIAASLLEELRKKDPEDMKTLAQLIAAYSKFDPKKAQSISKELPSPEELAQDVDVAALEASVSALGAKYIRKTTKVESGSNPTSPKSGAEDEIHKKKKKKRKGKLPKNYDPKNEPDPERWLPRWERSYYRGRRKDKKKDIGKGTQGAAATSSDLDASARKSPPASANGSEVGSPRPGSSPPGNDGGASGASSASAPAGTATPQAVPPPGSGPRQQKPGTKQKKKKKGKGGW
jgi:signal recognition particle subunit SRP72